MGKQIEEGPFIGLFVLLLVVSLLSSVFRAYYRRQERKVRDEEKRIAALREKTKNERAFATAVREVEHAAAGEHESLKARMLKPEHETVVTREPEHEETRQRLETSKSFEL